MTKRVLHTLKLAFVGILHCAHITMVRAEESTESFSVIVVLMLSLIESDLFLHRKLCWFILM